MAPLNGQAKILQPAGPDPSRSRSSWWPPTSRDPNHARYPAARHRDGSRGDRTMNQAVTARGTDALGRTTCIQKEINEVGARILFSRILFSRILLLRGLRLRDLILLWAHRRAGRSRIHVRKCEVDPPGQRTFDRWRRGHRAFHQRSGRGGKDRKPGHSAHGERSQGLPIGRQRTTTAATGPIGINVRKRAHRPNPPTNRTANPPKDAYSTPRSWRRSCLLVMRSGVSVHRHEGVVPCRAPFGLAKAIIKPDPNQRAQGVGYRTSTTGKLHKLQ